MIMMPTVTRMMIMMSMMMMMMMMMMTMMTMMTMMMMMVIMMMKKIKIKIKLYWLTQLLVSPLSLHCGPNLQLIPILTCKRCRKRKLKGKK